LGMLFIQSMVIPGVIAPFRNLCRFIIRKLNRTLACPVFGQTVCEIFYGLITRIQAYMLFVGCEMNNIMLTPISRHAPRNTLFCINYHSTLSLIVALNCHTLNIDTSSSNLSILLLTSLVFFITSPALSTISAALLAKSEVSDAPSSEATATSLIASAMV
jgi:hypothetical protein